MQGFGRDVAGNHLEPGCVKVAAEQVFEGAKVTTYQAMLVPL